MITTINLLPTEEKAAGTTRSVETLKKVSVIAAAIFIIAAVAAGGYVFYLSTDVSSTRGRAEALKAQVASFSDVESRLVLTSARLSKLRTLLASNSSKNIETLGAIASGLPAGASITETELTSDKLKVGVSVADTGILSGVFNVFGGTDVFRKIVLKTLSFNPLLGYFLSVDLESVK